MSTDDLHKILVPYLYATGLLAVMLAIAGWMLKRDGDRKRSEEPPPSSVKRQSAHNPPAST